MNGKDLKKLRTMLGKDTGDFAPMVHYKKNTIEKMEAGIRKITDRFEEYLRSTFPKQMKKIGRHARKNKKI